MGAGGPGHGRLRMAAVAILAVLLSSCALGSVTRQNGRAAPVGTLNPTGRVGLGAYVDGTPFDSLEGVQRFEALAGHKLQYVLWFQAWGDNEREFRRDWVDQAARAGLVPVITWEPWKRNFEQPATFQEAYSLQSIAAGQHDEYIRSWARGAKSVGTPLVLRFAHEQTTRPGTRDWYPWQGDPGGYRAAFRHIVGIFREEGARQVYFLWSAMWLDQEWVPQYYPGDDVVDIIGTTVLNHGTVPRLNWARWATFEELFDQQYRAAEQWGKPVMVTELASAEQGGSKAQWLRDCFRLLETRYPLVRGALLLEVTRDREWSDINWSIASSQESLKAFREAIASPYFR